MFSLPVGWVTKSQTFPKDKAVSVLSLCGEGSSLENMFEEALA
jgi:hypothetical protein